MGEKNQKNNGGQQKNESENKKKGNEEGKNSVTVVLKTDLHCEGCASKVIKCIRSFDGVDAAMVTDGQKIAVVGNVDPVKLREKLEQKTHKKVEVISALPKEDNSGDNTKGKDNSGGDNDNPKQLKKNEPKNKNGKDKSDDKKSKEKEPPVTTAVFKVHLHCEGCIQKIYKTVAKIKGYQELKIDKQKDMVTVTGAMDMKALAEVLKKNLKRDFQIVPPKKDDQEKKDGAVGGKGKNEGGGGGDGDGEKVEGNRLQFQDGFPYPFMSYPVLVGDPSHQHSDIGALRAYHAPQIFSDEFMYNPGLVGDPSHQHSDIGALRAYHAPQIFSDENPNACIVM